MGLGISRANLHWLPDEASDKCMKCEAPFSFLLRRHHCRECGDIICNNCSSHMTIPFRSQLPQRVCQECCKDVCSSMGGAVVLGALMMTKPPSDFSKGGISLKGLLQFVERYGAKLNGKSTSTVVEEIIKPLSLGMQCSYIEYLGRRRSGAKHRLICTRANIYVSHASGQLFLDLVETLMTYCQRHKLADEEAFFWLDCMVVNQHQRQPMSFEELQSSFGEEIRNIGKAIVVLAPWRNPLFIHRSWCIFELYNILHHRVEYEIAMPTREEKDFKKALLDGFWGGDGKTSLLAGMRISTENTHATDPGEEEHLKGAIIGSIGFYKLDAAVTKVLQEWFVSKGESYLAATDVHSEGYLKLLSHLALLMDDQGDYARAEALHRRGLEGFEVKYGRDHQTTLAALNNLAMCLSGQGRQIEAEPLHRDCLRRMEASLGAEHPLTLNSIYGYATCLYSQSKYNEAETLYRECLRRKDAALGRDHLSTLDSLDSLAVCLVQQEKYAEAEPLLADCLRRREAILGRTHPDTYISKNNLATCLYNQGKFREAEPLLRACLQGDETQSAW